MIFFGSLSVLIFVIVILSVFVILYVNSGQRKRTNAAACQGDDGRFPPSHPGRPAINNYMLILSLNDDDWHTGP